MGFNSAFKGLILVHPFQVYWRIWPKFAITYLKKMPFSMSDLLENRLGERHFVVAVEAICRSSAGSTVGHFTLINSVQDRRTVVPFHPLRSVQSVLAVQQQNGTYSS
jgi:hypothetical protein